MRRFRSYVKRHNQDLQNLRVHSVDQRKKIKVADDEFEAEKYDDDEEDEEDDEVDYVDYELEPEPEPQSVSQSVTTVEFISPMLSSDNNNLKSPKSPTESLPAPIMTVPPPQPQPQMQAPQQGQYSPAMMFPAYNPAVAAAVQFNAMKQMQQFQQLQQMQQMQQMLHLQQMQQQQQQMAAAAVLPPPPALPATAVNVNINLPPQPVFNTSSLAQRQGQGHTSIDSSVLNTSHLRIDGFNKLYGEPDVRSSFASSYNQNNRFASEGIEATGSRLSVLPQQVDDAIDAFASSSEDEEQQPLQSNITANGVNNGGKGAKGGNKGTMVVLMVMRVWGKLRRVYW